MWEGVHGYIQTLGHFIWRLQHPWILVFMSCGAGSPILVLRRDLGALGGSEFIAETSMQRMGVQGGASASSLHPCGGLKENGAQREWHC